MILFIFSDWSKLVNKKCFDTLRDIGMTKETDLPTLKETLKLAEHLVSHKIFMIEDGSGQMNVKLCP